MVSRRMVPGLNPTSPLIRTLMVGLLLTGPLLAADGQPVREWQTPESITTVLVAGRRLLVPSPITPLNLAKAGLDLVPREYARVALDEE